MSDASFASLVMESTQIRKIYQGVVSQGEPFQIASTTSTRRASTGTIVGFAEMANNLITRVAYASQ
jgi:hypothetical protein